MYKFSMSNLKNNIFDNYIEPYKFKLDIKIENILKKHVHDMAEPNEHLVLNHDTYMYYSDPYRQGYPRYITQADVSIQLELKPYLALFDELRIIVKDLNWYFAMLTNKMTNIADLHYALPKMYSKYLPPANDCEPNKDLRDEKCYQYLNEFQMKLLILGD